MIPGNNPIPMMMMIILVSMHSGMVFGQQEVIRLEGITDAGSDSFGNLYLSTERGSIIKYDSAYRKMLIHSPASVVPLTSIDASGNFRIFGFYRNDQGGLLLDRNFNILNEFSFIPYAGNVTAATYGDDHSIWLFDDQNFSLKKINPFLSEIRLDIRLPLLLETGTVSVSQIEEYQNRIYLNNAGECIYVFDIMGNLLMKFEVATASPFKFYRDKLFFIDRDTVKSIHVYSRNIETVYQITQPGKIVTAIPQQQGILLIFNNRVIRIG